MLFRNKELERALEFVRNTDWDVLCLQEVPPEFLTQLQALSYHLAYRIDVERLLPSGAMPNYVVILSRYSIVSQGEIPFPDYWHLLPWRARLSVRLLRPVGFSKIRSRGGMYADLATPAGTVRIFNLHLVLANPAWRLAEYETAMAERDPSKPTVVCGDFNILESRHITPINWLFGGHIKDALLHTRERTHIEKRFVEHSLTNALRGKQTHAISRSQLDHILVSHHFSIKNADVLSDAYGSDHQPIFAEVV